jgi:hypothetical protein
MKLKSVPLQIESYVNHLQYELAQGAKKMTSRLNMTSKDFDFLADTFKKMYRSAVATEVPGVMWFEPSSLGLGVREILPGPQAPNAATDFAELVDACRALDAELLDEYDSETINSALRRIRAIVGRGVKVHQEGGTQ